MRRSFRLLPPTHLVRVTVHGLISHPALSRAVSRFLGKLKYRLRTRWGFEYLLVNEWRDGHRHMNILVRTGADLPTKMVGELWEKSLPGLPSTHYCRPVDTPVGVANYVFKNLKSDLKKELPPTTFRGRIDTYSHGFFTKQVAALWEEQVREWYPR
jgi:hypothetical protein